MIARGEGVYLWDDAGQRYLDGTASLWHAHIGHGREDMAEAIGRQLRTLEAFQTFGDVANPPALELVERLVGLSPMRDPRVFLCLGGGDAIDTAAKLARQYWAAQGQPERIHLISRTFAYHGTHGFGTSLVGMESMRQGYGPAARLGLARRSPVARGARGRDRARRAPPTSPPSSASP